MIKIYNSAARKKQEFVPLDDGKVSMYVCGPTVYGHPHIGHARSAYIFDFIRKYLRYRKFEVTFIRNITDVDDKIINKAKVEYPDEDIKSAVKKVAQEYFLSYKQCMDSLGIEEPDREPKATEYIDKMQDFISVLLDKGFAYETGGDVYFKVAKAKDYGNLSGQSIEMMMAGRRIAHDESKKDPLDFALWKKAKEGESCWMSPWGPGRPGWHIECSVMSSDILGDEFDIHGGGIDLIFPHHENEIAQSKGAGKKFARYWIHNGLLTINKEKMAKSLGNFFAIPDVLKRYPASVLKLLYLGTHYSNPVDFSWDKMEEAKKAYERIIIAVNRLENALGDAKTDKKNVKDSDDNIFRGRFIECMDDDFNTAKALAVLFNIIAESNRILDSGRSLELSKLESFYIVIKEMSEVFGLTLKESLEGSISESEIEEKLRQRLLFKKERKFKEADIIRSNLLKKGIILEDTRNSTSWRRKI
ncbi:MAG: cysteine--tRNA ligase [Candidatus Omnitrophota bacterium]